MMLRTAALTLACLTLGAAAVALAQDVPAVPAVNSPVATSSLAVIQRQASPALDATPGSVSWAFPYAFNNVPTCYASVAATNTSYSFDVPIVTAIARTSVTIKLSAHPSSVSVTAASLGVPVIIPLTTAPPAGTTVTLTCVGPLP